MFRKFKKYTKNPIKIMGLLGERGIFNFMDDKTYLKYIYEGRVGKKLDLMNPVTFNEKLQWLKLYDRDPKYTQLVDKYEVREYIQERIGEEYLIPLIGVWNNFDEINFDNLPNQFVLKTTHDSGGVVICRDKSKLNVKSIKNKINKSLKKNYYYAKREWPYKNVKPRIIAEKFMIEESGSTLKDYKFFCFNGEVKMILVVAGLGSNENPERNFYDKDWNLLPFNEGSASNIEEHVDKPVNYAQMIEIAEVLSENIPFVRVDLYEVNGRIYFGELTFFPQSGYNHFEPEEYDAMLGSWLRLPV